MERTLYHTEDTLAGLNHKSSLRDKIRYIHTMLNERIGSIHRVAVALYDEGTDYLHTYTHSSGEDQPLSLYQAKLQESRSLRHIRESGQPRVVEDLAVFSRNGKEHSQRIQAQGYVSSYTLPMYNDGNFFGFLFFNSYDTHIFTETNRYHLDMFGHLLTLLLAQEIGNAHTMRAAVQTAREIANSRDNETGNHLERMSRYARLIALKLAREHQLDDQFVENVFLYSPLHDIGKVGIPDGILLKQGKLTDAEFSVMKNHTVLGREIVDAMLYHFNMPEGDSNAEILRNITHYHHEKLNGEGYPIGLAGEDIPLEARIVAVADVFDALTSQRPYKKAWDNDRAFTTLLEMTHHHLDAACVEALLACRDEVEEIQKNFREDFIT